MLATLGLPVSRSSRIGEVCCPVECQFRYLTKCTDEILRRTHSLELRGHCPEYPVSGQILVRRAIREQRPRRCLREGIAATRGHTKPSSSTTCPSPSAWPVLRNDQWLRQFFLDISYRPTKGLGRIRFSLQGLLVVYQEGNTGWVDLCERALRLVVGEQDGQRSIAAQVPPEGNLLHRILMVFGHSAGQGRAGPGKAGGQAGRQASSILFILYLFMPLCFNLDSSGVVGRSHLLRGQSKVEAHRPCAIDSRSSPSLRILQHAHLPTPNSCRRHSRPSARPHHPRNITRLHAYLIKIMKLADRRYTRVIMARTRSVGSCEDYAVKHWMNSVHKTPPP